MGIKTKVQLITYPDSLGGDLPALQRVLQEHFDGLFGGVHILPPFPSSGDRGFAPKTYLEIEARFGNWEDVAAIGRHTPVLLDLMVNHISAHSPFFQDYLAKGNASEYADLFLPVDKLWPGGEIPKQDLEKIFLRRTVPYSTYKVGDPALPGCLWTTFGKQDPSEQIDLDVHSPHTRDLLRRFLDQFSRYGVRMVRLDAVGYVIKKPGTRCFMVKPDIYEFMDWMKAEAAARQIELLPEVHAEYAMQRRLAQQGYWIYDFILPYLVLEALLTRSGANLKAYLQERPPRQFTMLDCHDGVPVKPDLNGLYDSQTVRQVVDTCLERGGNLSLIYSPRHRDPDGFDVHQIRGTYYSLLGCDDDAYLAARAIQFFTPGIPQVYYVGLLAGENDTAAAAAQGDGRAINRHNYSAAEIAQNLQRPVVQRLLKLMRFRNEQPAFSGAFTVLPCAEHEVRLAWMLKEQTCTLQIDLRNSKAVIICKDQKGETRISV
ncbi:MAG: sucrose 6(F)-phosphate phosphorylase [Chloroflexota bacterium]|nr:sucrose 6(F)-phosphate phosphorylase [Chloroflexota bacterium]